MVVVYNCEIQLEKIKDKSTIRWIKNVGLMFFLKVPFLFVLSLINWFNSQISSSDVKIKNNSTSKFISNHILSLFMHLLNIDFRKHKFQYQNGF